jgi:hypothetical protein
VEALAVMGVTEAPASALHCSLCRTWHGICLEVTRREEAVCTLRRDGNE